MRISPDELHVSDPAFLKELYAGGGRKRNRTIQTVSQFGVPQVGASEICYHTGY